MMTQSLKNMNTTRDFLFNGKIPLYQPKTGYRFSVDAPVLIWFASLGKQAQNCADLGTGCGVLSFGVLAADIAKKVVAVEIQPFLAQLAEQNAKENNFSQCFSMLNRDFRETGHQLSDHSFDLVIINPPFWSMSQGRLPQIEEKLIACHEKKATIKEWVKVASSLLHQKKGRLCTVFPASRFDELVWELMNHHLHIKRFMPVFSKQGKPAETVLIEARPGVPGDTFLEEPLVLYDANNQETTLFQSILNGDFSQKLQKLPDQR